MMGLQLVLKLAPLACLSGQLVELMKFTQRHCARLSPKELKRTPVGGMWSNADTAHGWL